MKNIELNNGILMPEIGYGTWQTPSGSVCEASVAYAIECGYRHIDTAACYNNEKSVGKGIILSGANRKDLFVTSKVWNTERGYNKTIKAFEKTLNDLQLDYLDLYLIHWPANKKQFDNWDDLNVETFSALIDLYKQGKIKSIGVSNFYPHHLKSLLELDVKPMVNQIEYHPGFMQEQTVDFCKANNIAVEAWSPLGSGRVLSNPTLVEIAQKYNKSVAQICIKWCLANNIIPLPKSVTPERIKANLQVYDFELDDCDVKAINNLPSFGGSGLNADQVDF